MNKFSEIIILFLAWASLVLGLLCFGVGLYLLPYLFDWFYIEIPELLLRLMPELATAPTISSIMEKLGIIIPFVIAGVGLMALSRYSSSLLKDERKDDEQEGNLTVPVDVEMEDVLESQFNKIKVSTLTKILLGILLIFLLLSFAEYLISIEFSLL